MNKAEAEAAEAAAAEAAAAEPINTLVFSGGGPDGALFVGALKSLIEHADDFDLAHVKTVVGYSVGSVISLMIGMRMTPDEIDDSIRKGFLSGALSKLDIGNLLNLPKRLGIDDGRALMDWLGDVMSEHGIDRNITFHRFQQLTGICIVVAVTNLTRSRTEFMDAQSTPDMSVLFAIRMSTSVPFLYMPIMWNGDVYIDGEAVGTPYMDVCSNKSCVAAVLNIVDAGEGAAAIGSSSGSGSGSSGSGSGSGSSWAREEPPNFQTYTLMLYRMLSKVCPCRSTERKMVRRCINIPSLIKSDHSPIKFNFMALQIDTKYDVQQSMRHFVEAGYDATTLQIFSSAQGTRRSHD